MRCNLRKASLIIESKWEAAPTWLRAVIIIGGILGGYLVLGLIVGQTGFMEWSEPLIR